MTPNPDAVIDLCERIERAVAEFALYVDEKRFASVGVSLGASGYPQNGETFDQMIEAEPQTPAVMIKK